MKNNGFTKLLTVAGTILTGLPIATPIILAILSLVMEGRFRFDYLMPAELFFLSLGGGALLIWAAIRSHSRLKMVAWSLGVGIVLFFGSQGLAVITGLADGRVGEESPWFIVLMSMLAIFILAMVSLFIGGVLQCKDIYRSKSSSKPGPEKRESLTR
jgi:hypothetical protein